MSTKAKIFSGLTDYVARLNGIGKPKMDWQDMYRRFPDFTFEAARDFGKYEHFGEAFGHKTMDMKVTSVTGKVAYLRYQEYTDNDENLAYLEV